MDSSPKRKRKATTSPELVANPFIKTQNLEWRVSPPPLKRDLERRRAARGDRDRGAADADEETGQGGGGIADEDEDLDFQDSRCTKPEEARHRSISPPPPSKRRRPQQPSSTPTTTDDHITYFASLLARHTLTPFPPHHPRLSMADYKALYNPTPRGAHFVVTQHDHPVAGPHYDLRLQVAPGNSAASWAIMYGLPGDANSRGKTGLGRGAGCLRNATETRVHCLWNSFVESGGWATGSLLVWDMGTYEVLAPRRRGGAVVVVVDDDSGGEDGEEDGGEEEGEEQGGWEALAQQEKLARAFASRKIRLRLHGARLPRGYTVNLRLTRDEDAAGRAKATASASKPRRRRRRGGQKDPKMRSKGNTGPDTSGESSSSSSSDDDDGEKGKGKEKEKKEEVVSAMEAELRELEDAEVRRTNAYAGAVNEIGSVHQRKWFLSLDREESGFVRGRRDGRVWWTRPEGEEEEMEGGNRLGWPFYVRGPEYERSVVTGRLGVHVLRDHGVVGVPSAVLLSLSNLR